MKKNEIGEGLDWEADVVLALRKSESRAWKVVIGFFIICLLLSVSFVRDHFRDPPAPKWVFVDKLTGDSMVVDDPSTAITSDKLNRKHWIKKFVIAHERYKFRLLQADYDTVKALASDKVFAAYDKRYDEKDGKQVKFGESHEEDPSIVSIVEKDGIATVRFEVKTTDTRTADIPTVTRVATMRFSFKGTKGKKEAEAIANPLGFSVDDYATDAELQSGTK